MGKSRSKSKSSKVRGRHVKRISRMSQQTGKVTQKKDGTYEKTFTIEYVKCKLCEMLVPSKSTGKRVHKNRFHKKEDKVEYYPIVGPAEKPLITQNTEPENDGSTPADEFISITADESVKTVEAHNSNEEASNDITAKAIRALINDLAVIEKAGDGPRLKQLLDRCNNAVTMYKLEIDVDDEDLVSPKVFEKEKHAKYILPN